MLIGGASIASALIFGVLAKVDWQVVAPLAAGMLAGSAIGPPWRAAYRPGCCAGSSPSADSGSRCGCG